MAISHRNALTDDPQARFFLAPETSQQRQYEALRAYFVEKLPSHEVAHRFGYTPGAFRVLCHQFRHDPAKRAGFFPPSTPGPHSAPNRDRVRNLAVAMRKRNLSVYDIRRELADAGHTISINALSVLLREEGFARLPRRLDEERPQAPRRGRAPGASPRSGGHGRRPGLEPPSTILPDPTRRPLALRPADARDPSARGPPHGRPPRLGRDPRRAGGPHPPGPQAQRQGAKESCHGPGL